MIIFQHFNQKLLFINSSEKSAKLIFFPKACFCRSRSHFHYSSFQLRNISFISPASISGNILYIIPASISENILYIIPASILATYFHHSSWGIHETLKIPSNINIKFCDELHATNCPRRIVRDELSCDELSGHQAVGPSGSLRYWAAKGLFGCEPISMDRSPR